MKLDSRIKDKEKIYDVFNCQEARKGSTTGYFTDNFAAFADLKTCCRARLVTIEEDNPHPFYAGIVDGGCIIKGNFQFFTSVDNTDEGNTAEGNTAEGKKYRPYTIEEFCNEDFEIVVFREKNNPSMKYYVRYNGYRKCDNVYKVILGNISYTLSDLFDDFEYLDSDSKWKPFGIEVR